MKPSPWRLAREAENRCMSSLLKNWVRSSEHAAADRLLSVEWELTSAVFVAEIREPPDVAQTDESPRHGQQEVDLARPLLPLRRLSLSLILRPCPRALARGRFEDVLVEIFQALKLFLCCHIFAFYTENKTKQKRKKEKKKGLLNNLFHCKNCLPKFIAYKTVLFIKMR